MNNNDITTYILSTKTTAALKNINLEMGTHKRKINKSNLCCYFSFSSQHTHTQNINFNNYYITEKEREVFKYFRDEFY